MSAEETELTFIRCPSCRSLVPAVATRCRMCGHQFEKKSAATEEESVEESSKKEILDSSATRPRVRQRTMSADSKQVSEIKEQLKSSLQQDVAVVQSDSEVNELQEEVEEETIFSLQKDTPERENTHSVSPVSSSSDFFKEESPLSEQKEEEETVEKNFTEETKTAVLSPLAANTPVQTDKVEMETKTEIQFGDLKTTTNGKKALAENAFGKEVVVENDGKLFGWLIAFGNDSRGAASEVRAGKFFIGRQKLRSADMLVPDSSVSTPHCMLTASNEAGLLVQDLLSEKGTFYKKAGSQNYVQVSHLIELCHGDWLKFGDYEVMVCLVPYEKNKKK